MEDKVRGHLALVLRGGGRLALHAGPEEDPVLPGHGLVQYSTVQYNTVQYSTVPGTPGAHRGAAAPRTGWRRSGHLVEAHIMYYLILIMYYLILQLDKEDFTFTRELLLGSSSCLCV